MKLNEVVSRLEKLDAEGLRGLVEVRDRQDMKAGLPAILRARTVLAESGNRDWQQATLDCSNAVLRAVRQGAAGKFDGVGLSAIMSAAEEVALAICARTMLKDTEYLLLVEPVAKICAHELLDIHGEGLAPTVMAPTFEDTPERASTDSKASAKAKLDELFGDDEEPEQAIEAEVVPAAPAEPVQQAVEDPAFAPGGHDHTKPWTNPRVQQPTPTPPKASASAASAFMSAFKR